MRERSTWIIGAAAACAVIGILLKLADLEGPSETPGPTAVRAPASEPPRSPAPEPDRFAAATDPSPPSDFAEPGMPAAPEGVQAPGRGLPSGGSLIAPRPSERKKAAVRERAAARRARREARRSGSLDVGVAGQNDAEGLGSGRHGAGTGTSGGTGGSAPATQEPPPPPQVAYTTGDEAVYATGEQVQVPDIGQILGRSGTVSFWLQPQWQEGNQDDANLLELGDGRLQVIKNVNFLRFEFTDEQGVKGGIGTPITDWKAGEWHQVTTTWTGQQFSLYVDGQLVSSTIYTGGPMQFPPDATLAIGSDFPLSRPVAPGVIGKVDVLGRPLGPGEVANLFGASGTRKN